MHVIIVDNGRSTQLGRSDFRNSLKKDYEDRFKSFKNIVCRVENLGLGVADLGLVHDGHDFADVEVAILREQFGVAENGSVWVIDWKWIKPKAFICRK